MSNTEKKKKNEKVRVSVQTVIWSEKFLEKHKTIRHIIFKINISNERWEHK